MTSPGKSACGTEAAPDPDTTAWGFAALLGAYNEDLLPPRKGQQQVLVSTGKLARAS